MLQVEILFALVEETDCHDTKYHALATLSSLSLSGGASPKLAARIAAFIAAF